MCKGHKKMHQGEGYQHCQRLCGGFSLHIEDDLRRGGSRTCLTDRRTEVVDRTPEQ